MFVRINCDQMAIKQTKKQVRASIIKTLEQQFESLKEHISDRKFRKNIRKASRALASGYKEKAKTEKPKKKATPRRKATSVKEQTGETAQ